MRENILEKQQNETQANNKAFFFDSVVRQEILIHPQTHTHTLTLDSKQKFDND